MAHRQYLKKIDPDVFCPISGFVDTNNPTLLGSACEIAGFIDPTDPVDVAEAGLMPNPFIPANGWVLLATFQNNSPYTSTFDPTIVASSGAYGWDMGDGALLMDATTTKSISYTYATTATRTVKLYGKGTCNITSIDFSSDNLVGVLNLSNDAFKTTASFSLQSNPLLTGVIFPSTMSVGLALLYLQSTGITGTLNLSMFTAFSNANIYVYGLTGLTSITFASSPTGLISTFYAYGNGFVGTLNLSMLNFQGSLSIGGGTPLMTGVTFASVNTGKMSFLQIYQSNITGTLDLSMFDYADSAQIQLYTNPLLTGVTFKPVVTGSVSTLSVYTQNIIGTLDLSMFTKFIATAVIDIHGNTSMTNILFSSVPITGIIRTLSAYGCTSLGYVNILNLLTTAVASLSWNFAQNTFTPAVLNHLLADINSISVAGYASRTIDITGNSGTKSLDISSGGYDGITARENLIAKSFTVTASLRSPVLAATTAATSITSSSAVSGGNITEGGGTRITASGVCWGTSSNPTISGSKTNEGVGMGVYASNLTGLLANKLYYVRAYATNTSGTAYGAQISFTTLP